VGDAAENTPIKENTKTRTSLRVSGKAVFRPPAGLKDPSGNNILVH
jgi:hypothetical protein